MTDDEDVVPRPIPPPTPPPMPEIEESEDAASRSFSRGILPVGHRVTTNDDPEFFEATVEQTTIPGTVVVRKRIQ